MEPQLSLKGSYVFYHHCLALGNGSTDRSGCPLPSRGRTASPRGVSWSRESESAQLVGRVIDPSVREDGEPEPDVQLAPSHGRLEPSAPAPSSELAALTPAPELPTPPAELGSQVDTPPEPGSSRPSSSGNQTSKPPVPWSDEFGISSRDRELELIGTEPMRISAPAAPSLHPEHRLSPTWTAIFATLLGLCTVATFIAIAVHLDRRQPRSVETQAKVAEALPASVFLESSTMAAL